LSIEHGEGMGSICCEHCTGACCKYLALPLDKPKTPRDFDDIRWYLMHQGVTVFIEDGDWYIQLPTACRHLRPDNLCGTYETRPKICREYKAGDCDYAGGNYGYDALFQCEADLASWLQKRACNGRGSGRASPSNGKRSAGSRAPTRSTRRGGP